GGRSGGHNTLRPRESKDGDVDVERASRGLNFVPLQVRSGCWRWHECQAAESGDKLAQELQPLGAKLGRLPREARDVAARSRQIWDQAAADGIERNCKDDGDDRCGLLYCRGGGSMRDNDVGLLPHKFGSDLGVVLRVSV